MPPWTADFLSPDLVSGTPRPTPDNSQATRPKDSYRLNGQKREAMAILEEMWKGSPAKPLFDKDWRGRPPVARGLLSCSFLSCSVFSLYDDVSFV